MGQVLALSIVDHLQQDRQILSRPITTLANMAGLTVNDVYSKLLPELVGKDLGEAIRYAEIGLKYAVMVDRNRLREEVGVQFVLALDQIIQIIKDGLDSSDNWIKRKAMLLHAHLMDEASEKRRFVESVLADDKFEIVKNSIMEVEKLEESIVEFEQAEDGSYMMDAIGDCNGLN